MLGAAVIPECDRPLLPAEPAGKGWLGRMFTQEIQQGQTFLLAPSDETFGEIRIHEQKLASGFGMGPHDRVSDFGFSFIAGIHRH